MKKDKYVFLFGWTNIEGREDPAFGIAGNTKREVLAWLRKVSPSHYQLYKEGDIKLIRKIPSNLYLELVKKKKI